MKRNASNTKEKPWHRKPSFGSLYTMPESNRIYISMYYFKQRLRFPTDREDTPRNWDELCDFMATVGQKISNRTFCFAKTFYWLNPELKEHFTKLEGGDYKPEPEHVTFGDYARDWMIRKLPTFVSVAKKRSYRLALESRLLPYFGEMPFSGITVSCVESFVDGLKRSDGGTEPLTVKRIKNIISPLATIWRYACNDHNWSLPDPFTRLSIKYKEVNEKALLEKERLSLLDDAEETSTRDVLLLAEWQHLLSFVDPHYHLAMELMLMGMIGSELEGLLKRHVKDESIFVQAVVVRDKGCRKFYKPKPKNWYRKRHIALTARLKAMVGQAAARSNSPEMIEFEDGIHIQASEFLLTMKDGRPFDYIAFRKRIWQKAFRMAGLDYRVPYAARHTLVQWSLLVGVHKSRLVDIMGHSTKEMVDRVYGTYRQGLIEERTAILDYLGDDFLALEELRTAFPERYQRKMAVPPIQPQTAKAPDMTGTFRQSFGQSQGLYPDNY